MRTPEQREAERGRRAAANDLNEAAVEYYGRMWDVTDVADVESDAGEFSHRAADKGSLQLLEYAGVDAILNLRGNKQVLIQEKWVMPTTNGDCLLFRADNGSDTIPGEADSLLDSYDDPLSFTPNVIAYGRANSHSSFRWLWLIDAQEFAAEWDREDGGITPSSVYHNTDDGTMSLMFSPVDVAKSGAVIGAFGKTPDRIKNGDTLDEETIRVLGLDGLDEGRAEGSA